MVLLIRFAVPACFVIALICVPCAFTQADFKFERITIEDGLSQSAVFCVLQDRHGFMWFGTQDGLNRYDGYDFEVFRQVDNDPESLSNNWISSIFEDSEGTIWVGTLKGLNRFVEATRRFERVRLVSPGTDNLEEPNVSAICEDRQGRLWIGTFDSNGLFVLDKNSGETTNFSSVFSGDIKTEINLITSICLDSRGEIWIGSLYTGFIKFNKEQNRPEQVHLELYYNGLLSQDVMSIHEDHEGMLWLAMFATGLVHYDPGSGEYRAFRHNRDDPNSLPSDYLYDALEDSSGRIWVTTRESGLAILDPKTGVCHNFRYDPSNESSISLNHLSHLYEGRSGLIWICTTGNGVCKYSEYKNKFPVLKRKPSKPEGLDGQYAYSILEDGRGDLWIGTVDGSLNRLDRRSGRAEHFDLRYEYAGVQQKCIAWSLFEMRDGAILAGTDFGVLFLIEPAGQKPKPILRTASIRVITELSDGRIILGTEGNGLQALRAETSDSNTEYGILNLQYKLHNDRIKSIFEDSKGFLWVGTEVGLHKINRETGEVKLFLANQEQEGSLNNDFILCTIEDDYGYIWIGTRGGPHRYRPETDSFAVYTLKDGLPNEVIYGILDHYHLDKTTQGNQVIIRGGRMELWMSTNRGLVKFQFDIDVEQNKLVLDLDTRTAETFDIGDGLQSDEFNTGAYFKSRSGELFFGGVKGVNYFFPEDIKRNAFKPPIVLTSFKVMGNERTFDRPLAELGEIFLPHDENFISIEFSALDYNDPGRNKYMYQMAGVDPQWVNAGTRRFVNYNLPHGEHTFRVKGSNADGVWNEEGISLRIVIVPPFWETLWFRILVIITGGGLIILVVYLRIRNINTQRRLLQSEVDKRTAELQEANLLLQKEVAERKAAEDAVKRHRDELQEAYRELEAFSYTISHDLKNPLSTIDGFSSILLKQYDGSLDEKGKNHLQKIRRNTAAMNRLIDDILKLSRATKDELDRERIDLSALARITYKTVKQRFPQHQVECRITEDLLVYGDPNLIRIVLENLYENAFKFSKSGQEQRLEFGSLEREGEKTFFLRDNGIGFDRALAGEIFLPFRRLHAEAGYEGSGIGLATVEKIIRRHGGRIWAEAEVDKGATFFFTLPNSGNSTTA